MPKSPSRTATDDVAINRTLDQHKQTLDDLTDSPFVQGRLIEGIELPDNTVVKIRHGIGRKVRSYTLTQPRYPAGTDVTTTTVRRSDWELVDSHFFDSPASSYTFDTTSIGAMDGDLWPFWQIRGYLVNSSANTLRYIIRPNGLARNANFYTRFLQVTGDTNTGTSTNTEANLGLLSDDDADEMRLTGPVTAGNTVYVQAQAYTTSGNKRTWQSICNRFVTTGASSGLITFVGAGAHDTSGNGSPSPTCPTVSSGDLMVLIVGHKYSGQTCATPSGWTAPANNSYTGGAGSSGVDSGVVRVTMFVKIADGSEDGTTVNCSISGGDASIAYIMAYRQTTGTNTWSYSCTGGSDNSVGTSWSVTGSADPDVVDNDWMVVGSMINGDDSGPWSSESISITGATMAAMTERLDQVTSLGDDGRLVIADSECTAGDSSAAAVYTMTATSTAGNDPAGATAMMRLRSVGAGTNTIAIDVIGAGWSDTGTNMTSLMIGTYDDATDNQSNGIGGSSWLELYRQATDIVTATTGVGMITEVAGADPTKEIWLKANGYGATVTVSMWVIP